MQDANPQLINHRLSAVEEKVEDHDKVLHGNGKPGVQQEIALMRQELTVLKQVGWLIFSTVTVLFITSLGALIWK